MYSVENFTLEFFSRYTKKKIPEVSSSSANHQNYVELIECVKNEDPAMFEVYKRIAWHFNGDGSLEKFDERFNRDDLLLDELKKLISELTLIEPVMRMKLEQAKEKLIEFESQDEWTKFDNFLLLEKRFRIDINKSYHNDQKLGFRSIR